MVMWHWSADVNLKNFLQQSPYARVYGRAHGCLPSVKHAKESPRSRNLHARGGSAQKGYVSWAVGILKGRYNVLASCSIQKNSEKFYLGILKGFSKQLKPTHRMVASFKHFYGLKIMQFPFCNYTGTIFHRRYKKRVTFFVKNGIWKGRASPY